MERFAEAHQYSLKLIELNYPDKKKALRIALECSLRAGMTEAAIQHCDHYLKFWQEEEVILLRQDLVNGIVNSGQ